MKKNLFIAFSGMDGSGKTTLAKKLLSYLKKKGYRVHFKHAHGYAISQNSFAIDEKMIERFRWLFFLLSPVLILDSLYTYYFKYKPLLEKYSLICDRYFYDKVARLIYYGVINKTLARFYLNLLPRPDAIIFLDVDVKKASARKKEYSPNQMGRFRNTYLFVAHQTRAHIVRTDYSVSFSLQKIVKVL